MDLREIKGKIGSVKNISELTSALETFSALKMRKTQKRFLQSKLFAEAMAGVLKRLEKSLKEKKSVFLADRPAGKSLAIVVASDRGFCGSFNANIFRFADRSISELRKENEIDIMPVGKKAVAHYKRENPVHSFFGVGDFWQFRQTKEISDFLISSFLQNKYQKIYLFYTHFFSSFNQKPSEIQLLPMSADTVKNFVTEESPSNHNSDYLFEPSADAVLNEIIPVFAEYLVYEFILSANTAEHSARMMAMRNASDNAKGLLAELRLQYNKARQEQITSEVCEISSTKEAME